MLLNAVDYLKNVLESNFPLNDEMGGGNLQ